MEPPVWSRFRTIWRFPDQGDPDDGLRRTKGGGRSSQVLCGPAGPILTEIHQPCAPRDPRTLAMVQGVMRHFEQIPAQKAGNHLRF